MSGLNNGLSDLPAIGPDPDLQEVIGLEVETTAQGQRNGKEKRLADFEAFRITSEKNIPPTPATITIGGAPVAAPGNITPITAEGKAGKTAATSVLIAGAISKDGHVDGFTSVEVQPNPKSKAIIHLDTEQSESDQQFNLIKILQRTGIKTTPKNFLSYNIRTLPMQTYQQFTSEVCELANQEFNGIHLIVVDGAADYITSVNDEGEANGIIAFFISLAVKYNCPVILIIHLNENASRTKDTMPRGHVGRQAVRKGYCQLNIIKDGDVSTLSVLRARKASSETPTVCFRYSLEKGYHVSIESEDVSEAKEIVRDTKSRKKAEAIARKVFAPPAAFTYKDALLKIMKETMKSESTAKRILREMEGWDYLKKGDDGFYRLSV